MITWREAFSRAAVSGSAASVASTAALMACGGRDCRSSFAPVNAVSHWIWGEEAIHRDAPSLRYTAVGYGIHHAMSLLWGVTYEKWRTAHPDRRYQPLPVLAAAAAVAAGACFVDLRCTPRRLTPGFERRLSPASLVAVYGAFAIGLAVCDAVRRRRERTRRH